MNGFAGTASRKRLFLAATFIGACFVALLPLEASAEDSVDAALPKEKDPAEGDKSNGEKSSEEDILAEENPTEELGALAADNWMEVFAALDGQKEKKPEKPAPTPSPAAAVSKQGTAKPAAHPAPPQRPAEKPKSAPPPPQSAAPAKSGVFAGPMGPLFERLAAKLNMHILNVYLGADACATSELFMHLDKREDVEYEEEEEPEEEDEEEYLAEAIIHGTKKKVIPRIKTAVDELVDEIEKEKIRKISKTRRQFNVLLERKKESDKKKAADSVPPPDYFKELAQAAAQYHQTVEQERRKRDAGKKLSTVQERLRRRAQRRRQRDKLMAWRQSQFAQVTVTPAQRQQHFAATRQESRDIEKTIDDDLDEMDWGDFLHPERQSDNESQESSKTKATDSEEEKL
ncbi:conserved hypothetical protein [Neospora caninum Liverpool]|uniref:Transmembrane protein n=1 Tax=Neospora caninum (strain Liverpool) TaxID=572307 RepID=F0V916_NEOCL|nr:conserved hypothetical protein [Neospora caninum Liverpool]CBZ50207.1 conserved hypothetical protein [Neospora caninum Liverpool]|eukprot:XP_003880242.1 conserved hypothetical protein [Neospora caninum Liverpool]